MDDRRPGFSYLFLLRVPIIVFFITVAFRPLAMKGGLSAYLKGMYDGSDSGVIFTAAVSILLWLALSTTTNTILRTAYLRFMVLEPPAVVRRPVLENIAWLRRIGFTDIWTGIAAAGIAYALGILWLLSGYAVFKGVHGWLLVFEGLALGAVICGALGVLVVKFSAGVWTSSQPGLVARLMRRLGTPEGYFDGNTPVAGHKFALNAMLLSLLLYGAGGLYGWYNGHRLPTLMCILLLLTNACWFASALSYLLDRWRIPVFLVLGLYGWASNYWSTDHVFPLHECRGACAPAVTAAGVVGDGDGPVILVATSGGGILAAAWTGRVLGELSSTPAFTPAVKLISGVSGGSNGAMHFVNQMRSGQLTPASAFDAPARSSLDAVAWGLTYPDFLRTLPTALIFQPKIDRAVALREAWTAGDPGLHAALLSQWTPGQRTPAVVFNSTVAETGERFMFANYKVGPAPQDVKGRRVFYESFTRHDVPVSAAVASSAAFPYVSPAARADQGDGPPSATKLFHLVDGGYYDNYGVASALDFLRDALPKLGAKRRVLLLQIEASPANVYTNVSFESQGWFYQAMAPIKGFVHMWQLAARVRNSSEVEWAGCRVPQLQVAHFVYSDPEEYPTSWHLTAGQKEKIKQQWSSQANEANAEVVRKFLSGEPAPAAALTHCADHKLE